MQASKISEFKLEYGRNSKIYSMRFELLFRDVYPIEYRYSMMSSSISSSNRLITGLYVCVSVFMFYCVCVLLWAELPEINTITRAQT